MRGHLTVRNVITVMSGIVLAGLALSGVAYAVSSAAFRYSTPQTGFLMIPAAAFVPETETVVYHSGTELTTTGFGCFYAPVNLPHGAKMTVLTMWYRKNDAVQSGAQFLRKPVIGFPIIVANLIPPSTNGEEKSIAVRITDPSLQLVNNAHYAYSIFRCLSDTENFTAARITYTYTSAGD
jgi:hypothetical protein